MAYRRRTTVAKRRAPISRRRRSLGAAFTGASVKAAAMTAVNGAIGGAAAALLTNVIGDNLGQFKPYTGLLGAVATAVFLKRPEIAAGMAGYSGAKVAAELSGMALLQDNNSGYLPQGSNMYLQGYETPGLSENMTGSGIYASNYTLAGYGVPGL